MAIDFKDSLSNHELSILSSIVQVGDSAYKELMENQESMFGHPYFYNVRGIIRTKLVQMQCEIESHDSGFPFSFTQREFSYKHIIPELRTNNIIIHIARSNSPTSLSFKSKYKARFTRAKTIGEDYTEERLKERIAEREFIKTPAVKKRIGNVIDTNTNVKVKESKGYEYWATKHNLNTMAESVIFLREQGIKSVKQLDEYIQKAADERQNLQDKIKVIDKEMQELSAIMEQVHTVKKYRQYYKEYKANPSDKTFFEEYKVQIPLYENALSELKKSYSKLPNSRDILSELDKLQEKKNTLMQEYSSSKSIMNELYKIRKNYGIYMGKEMER